MSSSRNLRHGLCIFTLIGVLGNSGAAQVANPFSLLPTGSTSNGFGIQRTTVDVVAFRLNSKIVVGLDAGLKNTIELQAGDIIDAAFEMPADASFSSLRSTLGEDNYIKWMLAKTHQGSNLEMKIKDASNDSIEGKIVYIAPQLLRETTLVYDPGFGKVGPNGVEMGDSSALVDSDGDGIPDSADLTYDGTQWGDLPAPAPGDEVDTEEMPDFEAKTQGPKGPVRIAPPRKNLPAMKPGMSNLSATINSAFAVYSQSGGVNKLVKSAYSHVYTTGPRHSRHLTYVVYRRVRVGRHFRYRRQTLCWRAVKDALHSSGLVSSGFASASPNAYMARNDLLQQGFRDLLADPRTAAVMSNPNNAPKGAIMVYEDVVRRKAMANNSNPGHAEIKTTPAGQGGYISITPEPVAAYGNFARGKRKLIGVMVRDT